MPSVHRRPKGFASLHRTLLTISIIYDASVPGEPSGHQVECGNDLLPITRNKPYRLTVVTEMHFQFTVASSTIRDNILLRMTIGSCPCPCHEAVRRTEGAHSRGAAYILEA